MQAAEKKVGIKRSPALKIICSLIFVLFFLLLLRLFSKTIPEIHKSVPDWMRSSQTSRLSTPNRNREPGAPLRAARTFTTRDFLHVLKPPSFLVAPYCSQGATLQVTLQCCLSSCLSKAGPPPCVELTTPPTPCQLNTAEFKRLH